jgi:hypothetical protein
MIKTVMQPVKPHAIDPADLVGPALDHAVAQALGVKVYPTKRGEWMTANYGEFNHRMGIPYWRPSTDWSQGGPIIEREKVTLDLTDVLFDHVSDTCIQLDKPEWWASKGDVTGRGPTPLIAAMRCLVASKGTVMPSSAPGKLADKTSASSGETNE